jgi:hypothetical protein
MHASAVVECNQVTTQRSSTPLLESYWHLNIEPTFDNRKENQNWKLTFPVDPSAPVSENSALRTTFRRKNGRMTISPLLHCRREDLVPQIHPQQQIYKGVYARLLTFNFTLTQLLFTQLLTRFLYSQLLSPCRSAGLLSSSKRSMRIRPSVLRGSKKRIDIVEEILSRQIGREKNFCFNQLIVFEHMAAAKQRS